MYRPSILVVGSVLRWVIQAFNSSGALVDADSNPTIAIRKNGSAIGDSVTIVKRSATTGIYDCEYNPAGELEGDSFTFHETVTISTIAYANDPWVCQVVAVERGTDGANTTTPPTAEAIASAVRVELTDELEIINNIPDSFEFVVDQISAIQTVFYISPTYGILPNQVRAKSLRPYFMDTSRIGPIIILDNNKEEVDLTQFDGDLYVVVEDSDTNEVLMYDADPHYILHNLYIDPSPESVGVLDAPLCWALRRISNNQLLMEGPWEVQNAAYGTE